MRITLLQAPAQDSVQASWDDWSQALSECAPCDLLILPGDWLGAPVDAATAQRLTQQLSEHASRRGCWLLGGSWIEQGPGRQERVSCLFDALGELRARLCGALQRDAQHAPPMALVDSPFGRLGLLHGEDIWVWESSRVLGLQGAELLLVPGHLGRHNLAQRKAALWGLATVNSVGICFASADTPEGEGWAACVLPDAPVGELQGPWARELRLSLPTDTLSTLRDADLTFRNTLWFGLWSRRKQLYAPLHDSALGAAYA